MILAWAFLLLLYDALSTVLTRAVASRSLVYHAAVGVATNATWLVMQTLTVLNVLEALGGDRSRLLLLGAVYVVCSVTGSVGAHWLAMRFEK